MAINQYKKLSNVIGAPFRDYVLDQLSRRALNNSTGRSELGPRTNDQILYLANKTAWARLASSVDISPSTDLAKYVDALGVQGSGAYFSADSLAKNWVLQAGTSIQDGNGVFLRQGIGPNGTYGLGGTEELGYRPMPGLTSITVETTGRLGSLRTATLNFKVWNLNQLNVIEALYFRLGYSMLLEWGHTQYYKVNPDTNNLEFVNSDVYGIDDPFNPNLRKETVQQEIEKKRLLTNGNYDGMLGVVTNYNWTMTQDGGYDCTVRLVGLGAIIDTVRINQVYKLPKGLVQKYQEAESAIIENFEREVARKIAIAVAEERERNKTAEQRLQEEIGRVKTLEQLKTIAQAFLNFQGTDQDFARRYGVLTPVYGGTNGAFDYFLPLDASRARPEQLSEVNLKRGLWLSRPKYGFVKIQDNEGVTLNLEALNRLGTEATIIDYLARNPNGSLSGASGEAVLVSSAASTPTGKAENSPFIYLYDYGSGVYLEQKETRSTGLGDRGSSAVYVEIKPADLLRPGAQESSNLVVKAGNWLARSLGFGSSEDPELDLVQQQVGRVLDRNVVFFPTRQLTRYALPGKPDLAQFFFFTNWQITTELPVDYGVRREDFVKGLADWANAGAKAIIESTTLVTDRVPKERATGYQEVLVRGFFIVNTVATLNYRTPQELAEKRKQYELQAKSDGQITAEEQSILNSFNPGSVPTVPVQILVNFSTNNTGVILTKEAAVPIEEVAGNTPGQSASTDANNITPEATTPQKDPNIGFESSLHAMLAIVQAKTQEASLNLPAGDLAQTVDLTEITKLFYEGGILAGVLDLSGSVLTPPTEFDLTKYAVKGFNSQLMADNSEFAKVPYVGGSLSTPNFSSLCRSLVVRYQQGNPKDTPFAGSYPVYIPLGYLLAFLNNECLIYDSKERPGSTGAANGQTRPYIYIDFNPETNFCLTKAEQFSIDPNVCLIPANLDQAQFGSIFPNNVQTGSFPGGLFNPRRENQVSQKLDKAGLTFKTDTPYRGKVMNIMVRTQYLEGILREFSTGDPEHAVALYPFLERIMRDVNKALGNMNSFRVAYRDDTNTVQILDDQYVPPLDGESNIIDQKTYYDALKQGLTETVKMSGELPIFSVNMTTTAGNNIIAPTLGMARQFQLKTSLSTKMSSKIAISAQAATGSVNATDHTSLSWLNRNFQDRYKTYIQDEDTGRSGTSTAINPKQNNVSNSNNVAQGKPQEKSNDQKAAELFNTHVKSVYGTGLLAEEAIEPSKNYYIERMSKVKSNDPVTAASFPIPLELEMTLDGISGIIMGNAFNVPANRLPRAYLGPDNLPKVGFIVVGLAHNIQNNEWTTSIRGQMIKLREDAGKKGKVFIPEGTQSPAAITGGEFGNIGGPCDSRYRREITDAMKNKPGFNLLKTALTNQGFNSRVALASILAIAGGESNWEGTDESFRFTEAQLRKNFSTLTNEQISRVLAAKDRGDRDGVFAIIYGERRVAGNLGPADGARYYGRGFIQLTGRANYEKIGNILGIDLVNNPQRAGGATVDSANIAVAYYKDRLKGVDINAPDFFERALRATGNTREEQVLARKIGYYNCLLNII